MPAIEFPSDPNGDLNIGLSPLTGFTCYPEDPQWMRRLNGDASCDSNKNFGADANARHKSSYWDLSGNAGTKEAGISGIMI